MRVIYHIHISIIMSIILISYSIARDIKIIADIMQGQTNKVWKLGKNLGNI